VTKEQRHTYVGTALARALALSGGTHADVIGESTVMIVDARKATVEARAAGQHSAARRITLHVLTTGVTFEVK
jgi:hypothetical protein